MQLQYGSIKEARYKIPDAYCHLRNGNGGADDNVQTIPRPKARGRARGSRSYPRMAGTVVSVNSPRVDRY